MRADTGVWPSRIRNCRYLGKQNQGRQTGSTHGRDERLFQGSENFFLVNPVGSAALHPILPDRPQKPLTPFDCVIPAKEGIQSTGACGPSGPRFSPGWRKEAIFDSLREHQLCRTRTPFGIPSLLGKIASRARSHKSLDGKVPHVCRGTHALDASATSMPYLRILLRSVGREIPRTRAACVRFQPHWERVIRICSFSTWGRE